MYKILFAFFMSFSPFILNATQYVCSEAVLSMHVEPKELSSVTSQVIWGMSVEVLFAQDSRWVKIRTKDNLEGWVEALGLTKFDEGTYPHPGYMAQVKSLFANVYLIQDVKLYPPLLRLPFGSIVEVMLDLNYLPERWIPIRLFDGQVAYIQKGDLEINPQTLSRTEMVALAERFIGLPFMWGGTSSYGFDCSGFVQTMYRQMGIELPRRSFLQNAAKELQTVSLDALQPADLLFFSDRPDEVITHVGMFVGDSQFIHASLVPTPIIQKTSIYDPHWQPKFKRAARFTSDR